MVNKLLIGSLLALLGACATCPKPEIVQTPIAIHAKQIDLKACPKLPIIDLTPESNWDARLSSWSATIVILQGCLDSRNNIILELNRP